MLARLPCSAIPPDLAGACDYTCGLCTPAQSIATLPTCATYVGSKSSYDYYDSWANPQDGSFCAVVLADEKKSCSTTFSPTGLMAHFCDHTCRYCVDPGRHARPAATTAEAARQCRLEKCAPVGPVWARLAGPSHSCSASNFWRTPADCAAFVNTNNGQQVEIPSRLPLSPSGYTVDNSKCGALAPNWAIEFGLSSLHECLQRCDLPGCASTDSAAGCQPTASQDAHDPAAAHHAASHAPAKPASATPSSSGLEKVVPCVLLAVCLGVVLAVGMKSKAWRERTIGKQRGDELGNSIYHEAPGEDSL